MKETFSKHWGYIQISDEEVHYRFGVKQARWVIDPGLFLVAEIDNTPIAFKWSIPDYNQIFKSMNGKLFPLNFIKLFTQKKNIDWVRILTLGIIPEYQKRGLDTVFYWEIIHRAKALNIQLGEASWVLEDNDMMNRGLALMNAERYKRYRIWECEV